MMVTTCRDIFFVKYMLNKESKENEGAIMVMVLSLYSSLPALLGMFLMENKVHLKL